MPTEQDEVVKIVVEVVDKFTKPLNDLKKELDSFSEKGGSGASKVKKNFDSLRETIHSVASSISGALTPSLRALGFAFGGLAAMMGAAVNALKNFGNTIDTLRRLSNETGISIDKMREMTAVGRRLGITAGEMQAGMRGFAEAMHSVRLGTDVFGELAQRGLGQYAAQLRATKNNAQALELALKELDRIRDPQHRREFLRIQHMPEGLADATGAERQKLIEEYRKTGGGPVSADTVKKAEEFGDALWRSGNIIEGKMKELAEKGGLKELAEALHQGELAAIAFGNALEKATGVIEEKLLAPRSKDWHLPEGKEGESTWDRILRGLREGFRKVEPGHPAGDDAISNPLGMSFQGGGETKAAEVIKIGTSKGVIDAFKQMALDTTGGPGGVSGGFGANVIKASLGGGNYSGGRSSSGGGNDSEPAPRSGGPGLKGSKRQVAGAVADELRKGGLSEAAIAGIMANIQSESNFDPTLRHADQPKFGGEAHFAHGLYQEGGTEWNNYAKWLKENHPGEPWQNPRLQTQFLIHRMKTGYPKLWEKLKHLGPTGAANAFLHEYLKPAPGYQAQRHRQYERGVPGVEHYTGPGGTATPQADVPKTPAPHPAVPRDRLLDASMRSAHFAKVEGNASVRIDLNGFPRGTKTQSASSGIFSEVELHRGNTLPLASESA